jgi:DNA-directed RNA polymerase I and III subunit RPAC1
VRPVHDDILIAKLRPGQEIEMEFICEKGIGKTHSKWSPVCPAYYRMLPDIRFKEEVTGADADELKRVCPMGVFDIEDIGSKHLAVVKDGGVKCTACRECIRHEKFSDKISVGKRKDVFEFTVESVGVYKPE